jgi:methionyl-tRNA formyltransferase
MTGTPVRIVFVGSGDFGLPTLRQLITDKSVQVVQVVSQPDRPSGRGRIVRSTPVANASANYCLPLLRTKNINAEKLPAADLLVVIAFGQKIGPALARADGAAAPRLGAINLHASLLPRHRGAAPIHYAILSGDRETGNSVIRLAEQMDAGAVLEQSRVKIGEIETTGELHDRLAVDGAELVMRTIAALARGDARETEQDDRQATAAPKLSAADRKIDWGRPAVEVANKIRGMFPWPGCRVKIGEKSKQGGNEVTLVRARALDGQGPTDAMEPGMIDQRGHVLAGDGRFVEVIELRAEGKVMKLADYARGRPWRAGMHVKSTG